MKKKYVFSVWFVVSAVLFPVLVKGQTTRFQRVIGGTGNELSYSMVQTNDGGYILTGETTSGGAGGTDAYLIKTDGLGKVLWNKCYGTTGNETGWKVKQTRDSGFIVVGTTSSKRGDGLMFKTDKDGNIQWTKVMDSDSTEDIYNVIESRTNGDFYITGVIKTDSFGTDAFLAKYSSAGVFRWQKKFGGRQNEEGYSLVEELNGAVAVVGVVVDDSVTTGGKNGAPNDEDFFITRFDKNGNLKWMRNYGTNGSDQIWDIKMFKDQYIMAGWSNSGPGSTDLMLSIVDTFGAHVNSFTYQGSGSSRAFSVIVNPDETFSLTGYMATTSNGRDAFYLNTSKSGVVNSFNLFGGTSTDGHWPSDVTRTIDGGYTVFTTTASFKSGSSNNLYMVRMDNKGASFCNQGGSTPSYVGGSISSGSFGSIRGGAIYNPITLTTSSIKTPIDTLLCCKLQVQLAGTSARVCKGEGVRIGKPLIPGYVYKWTEVGGTFTSTEASPFVRPTKNTTYKLVVNSADGKCLPDSGTITVYIRPELSNKSFVRDTFFCVGGSVEITARSGMIYYDWKGKKTNLAGQTITMTQSDTLILTVTDTTTCTYKDTMVVSVKKLPVFSLGNDTTICDNTKITLTGPAGMASYLWNGGEGKARTFVTSEEKTHTLAVTDQFGCKYSDSKIIYNNPASTFSLGPDTAICRGINYTIFGPGFMTNFFWNGVSSFSANKTVNTPGTYILQASNSFGCIHIDTIVIKQKPEPTFNLGPDGGVCANGGRILKGPAGAAVYQWNDGSNTQNLEVYFPGTYWLKVTGTNGCIFSDSISLVTVNNPVPDIGKDTTICDYDSIYLDAGNYVSYSWNTGETTRKIKVKKSGLYEVTVTDNNTCKGVDDRSVKTKFCVKSVKKVRIPGFKVYPNPATHVINLEWLVKYTDAKVSVYDATGKLVYHHGASPGMAHIRIDVSTWERGLYFVELTTGATKETVQIQVQ